MIDYINLLLEFSMHAFFFFLHWLVQHPAPVCRDASIHHRHRVTPMGRPICPAVGPACAATWPERQRLATPCRSYAAARRGQAGARGDAVCVAAGLPRRRIRAGDFIDGACGGC